MQRFLMAVWCLVWAGGQLCADDATKGFFFQKGDRIVFLGDSITEQYQYSSYLELYLTTRFPQWNLTFINAGIGGDTAAGGAGRFPSHVLAEKPTAVTINFGMNDAGYGAFNPQANKNYVGRTAAMLEMAKKAKVRVALLSPNAVDRRVQDRFKLYVETQKQFYAPLKDVAAKHGAVFVDQYAITRGATEKMEADDPSAAKVKPYYDGFHTSPPGGLLMAHAILTGLHAPHRVSDVSIQVSDNGCKADLCQISNLKAMASGVSFERRDEALPLPIQNDWVSVLPYVNDLKDLNWCGLKVAGLASGKYALTIDGKEIATFTSEELAKGVNVGNVRTGPLYEQGKKVLDAINAKNILVHQRFRGVVMFVTPDWLADVVAERRPAELAKRMARINTLQAEIYQMAQPKTHRWVLQQTK